MQSGPPADKPSALYTGATVVLRTARQNVHEHAQPSQDSFASHDVGNRALSLASSLQSRTLEACLDNEALESSNSVCKQLGEQDKNMHEHKKSSQASSFASTDVENRVSVPTGPFSTSNLVRKQILRNKFRAFVRKHRIDSASFQANSMFKYPIDGTGCTDKLEHEAEDESSVCMQVGSLEQNMHEHTEILASIREQLITRALFDGAFSDAPDSELLETLAEIQQDPNFVLEVPSSDDDDNLDSNDPCGIFVASGAGSGAGSSSDTFNNNHSRDLPIRSQQNGLAGQGILKQAAVRKSLSQTLRKPKAVETERQLRTSKYVKMLGITEATISKTVQAQDNSLCGAVVVDLDGDDCNEQYFDLTGADQ